MTDDNDRGKSHDQRNIYNFYLLLKDQNNIVVVCHCHNIVLLLIGIELFTYQQSTIKNYVIHEIYLIGTLNF